MLANIHVAFLLLTVMSSIVSSSPMKRLLGKSSKMKVPEITAVLSPQEIETRRMIEEARPPWHRGEEDEFPVALYAGSGAGSPVATEPTDEVQESYRPQVYGFDIPSRSSPEPVRSQSRRMPRIPKIFGRKKKEGASFSRSEPTAEEERDYTTTYERISLPQPYYSYDQRYRYFPELQANPETRSESESSAHPIDFGLPQKGWFFNLDERSQCMIVQACHQQMIDGDLEQAQKWLYKYGNDKIGDAFLTNDDASHQQAYHHIYNLYLHDDQP